MKKQINLCSFSWPVIKGIQKLLAMENPVEQSGFCWTWPKIYNYLLCIDGFKSAAFSESRWGCGVRYYARERDVLQNSLTPQRSWKVYNIDNIFILIFELFQRRGNTVVTCVVTKIRIFKKTIFLAFLITSSPSWQKKCQVFHATFHYRPIFMTFFFTFRTQFAEDYFYRLWISPSAGYSNEKSTCSRRGFNEIFHYDTQHDAEWRLQFLYLPDILFETSDWLSWRENKRLLANSSCDWLKTTIRQVIFNTLTKPSSIFQAEPHTNSRFNCGFKGI